MAAFAYAEGAVFGLPDTLKATLNLSVTKLSPCQPALPPTLQCFALASARGGTRTLTPCGTGS